jgi:hypothetical protein
VPGGVSFAIKAPPFVTSTIRLGIVDVKAFAESGLNQLTCIMTALRTAIFVSACTTVLSISGSATPVSATSRTMIDGPMARWPD